MQLLLDELLARGRRGAGRWAGSISLSVTPCLAACPPVHLVGTQGLSDSPEAAWVVRSRTPNDASCVTVSPTPPPAPGVERACCRHACSERGHHPGASPRVPPAPSRTARPSATPCVPGIRKLPAHLGQRGPLPTRHICHLALQHPSDLVSNVGTFVTPACRILGCWGDPSCPDQLAPCRDGLPYCEADYHAEFGVRCDSCEKFITGHVLEVSGPRRLSPAPS